MAHNSRIRAPGFWTASSVLLASEMELFDQAQYESANFDDGGTWAPASEIIVGGSGVRITSTLTIPNGAIVNVSGPSARFNVINDAIATFEGAVRFRFVTTWQAGYTAGAAFETGTSLTINSGATVYMAGNMNVQNGATVLLASGATLLGASGSTVGLNGSSYVGGGATMTVGPGGGYGSGALTIGASGSLVVLLGGSVNLAGTMTHASGALITHASGSAEVHANGSHDTYQNGSSVTFNAGANVLSNADVTINGATTLGSTLSVAGNTSILGSTLSVAGNTSIAGATTLGSTLSVAGNTSIAGTLTRTGPEVISGTGAYTKLRAPHTASASGETIDISEYDMVEIPLNAITGTVNYTLTAPAGVRCRCQFYTTAATIADPSAVAVLKQGATRVGTISYNGTYAFGSVIITYDGTTMIPHAGKGASDGA